MQSLVLGFGVSGQGAAAFLKSKGHSVVAVDKKPSSFSILEDQVGPLHLFDQLILSPGITPKHPLVLKAKEMGIEVIGEAELGFRNVQNKLFAITGSNGKTSTVTLTEHVLKNASFKAKAIGNVGESICEYLTHPDPEEILIMELSSFQLETLQTKAAQVGCILNIVPNHLDRYSSFDEYAKAKIHLQNCIQEGGSLYVSSQVMQEFGSFLTSALCFQKELALIEQLKYTGLEMPSKQSVTAAYLLCKRCGVTDTDFLQSLKTYKKPPHRIEWVAKIDGVSYYNDSKSSNIHSVIHAVEEMQENVILIAGGVHKGSPYTPWIEGFKGKVFKVIAYGEAASLLEKDLSASLDITRVDRFEEAVLLAKEIAKEGDTVLLSPGGASYDQFANYEERGKAFRLLVRGQ